MNHGSCLRLRSDWPNRAPASSAGLRVQNAWDGSAKGRHREPRTRRPQVAHAGRSQDWKFAGRERVQPRVPGRGWSRRPNPIKRRQSSGANTPARWAGTAFSSAHGCCPRTPVPTGLQSPTGSAPALGIMPDRSVARFMSGRPFRRLHALVPLIHTASSSKAGRMLARRSTALLNSE